LVLFLAGTGLTAQAQTWPAATLTPPAWVGPMPTYVMPEELRSYLSLAAAAQRGRPPFTAVFTAFAAAPDLPAMLSACQQLIWQFGDGRRASQRCSEADPDHASFQIEHVYERPGTYYARAQMALADGRLIESRTSQTVVVADPQAEPLARVLLYALAWPALMAVVALAAYGLRQRPHRQKTAAYLLLGLLLIGYVPPFSYLPDPLGLLWRLGVPHVYDPRLPFGNRFVSAGDPTRQLRPYLDALIGQTGLDPLDPVEALAAYRFVRVATEPFPRRTLVRVRFIYADGSWRLYDVPLYQPRARAGFYHRAWFYDGLGRVRAEHLEMPGIPFAAEDAALRPGLPRPAAVPPFALDLDDYSGHWQHASLGDSGRALSWSPQGDAFLVYARGNQEQRDLWLTSLDGGQPRRLARNVANYAWTPDGRAVVFSPINYQAGAAGLQAQLYRVDREGRQKALPLPGDVAPFIQPHVGNDGVHYIAGGALWFLAYDRGKSIHVVDLPQAQAPPSLSLNSGLVALSPDGQRVAYSCYPNHNPIEPDGASLCLQGVDGERWLERPLAAPALALRWRADGQQLAVTQGHNRPNQPVLLTLLARDGRLLRELTLAPDGHADAAQWLAGGRYLVVPVYPWGGRRILLVDGETGAVTDLSRPRWDAFFDLHPDGRTLLLWNGRGGFWLSDLPGAEDVKKRTQITQMTQISAWIEALTAFPGYLDAGTIDLTDLKSVLIRQTCAICVPIFGRTFYGTDSFNSRR
jgi:hypothetical protein